MPRLPDLPCSSCGTLMWRSRTSLPAGQAKCRPCRAAAPIQHGTYKGYRTMRCRCTACKAWSSADSASYRRRRLAGELKNDPCSIDACNRVAWSRGMCTSHYKQWGYSTGTLRKPPSDHWNDQRKSNWHSRRASIGVSDNISQRVLLAEVIERDGSVCAGCGEEVDLNLTWPHPMYKSLDHRIPISRGGSHTIENAQLMHVACNASKGNRLT